MAITIAAATEATTRLLADLFASTRLQRVGFRLWDGTRWPDDRVRPATLVLKHPAALREMFADGTEKALAEAFLREDFDLEGDTEAAFELADALGDARHAGWLKALRSFYLLHRLPAKPAPSDDGRAFVPTPDALHTLSRDRHAVSFHYDLSNEFYQLWLDRRMVYSCAYFERDDASLDAAQEAKLRHLCRKLRLCPGQRLLDIGCGWGGLALYAAEQHGVHVTGVTLSRKQAELAQQRARAAGLGDRVTIALKDYRELRADESFDAIVSVGMSEHVGRTQLGNYFRAAHGLLRPGGVFLNHAIGEGVRPRQRVGPSFIEEYVFPDSDIPPAPLVLAAAESAGFEVRDVENLREHYARTLRHWVSRLEAAHTTALHFVNEATFRVWRIYMAGSAHSFARGNLAVYQVLLSKLDVAGDAHLPLTRRDWYANDASRARTSLTRSAGARPSAG